MKTIKSFDDYLNHTENHIERVLLLSLFIYRNNSKYKNINIKELYNYMINHDKGKTDKFLAKMYPYYGKEKDENFKNIVNELNNYDKKISDEYFQINNIKDKEKDLMLEIEKIADCIDRNLHYLSPEEFCVKKMVDIKNFLSQEELELAIDAYHNYRAIVRFYY